MTGVPTPSERGGGSAGTSPPLPVGLFSPVVPLLLGAPAQPVGGVGRLALISRLPMPVSSPANSAPSTIVFPTYFSRALRRVDRAVEDLVADGE